SRRYRFAPQSKWVFSRAKPNSRSAASSTTTAWSTTSVPMPSPGMRAIFIRSAFQGRHELRERRDDRVADRLEAVGAELIGRVGRRVPVGIIRPAGAVLLVRSVLEVD